MGGEDEVRRFLTRMNEARNCYPNGTWAQRWIPGVCKHEHTRCVHGDEIMHRGWRRTACLTCGRSLKRPLPEMCWFSRKPHASAAWS